MRFEPTTSRSPGVTILKFNLFQKLSKRVNSSIGDVQSTLDAKVSAVERLVESRVDDVRVGATQNLASRISGLDLTHLDVVADLNGTFRNTLDKLNLTHQQIVQTQSLTQNNLTERFVGSFLSP